MVAGEICDPPPTKPVVPVEVVAGWAGLGISKPEDWVEDAADEASDWMAPNAVDAAPKANSMVKLRNTPLDAAHTYTPVG
jgi:hypothetical protein